MPEIKLNTGKHFQVQVGVSMLDAALQAGITMPYSCKTGRCSTCKCKVISGETTTISFEQGLTQDEKQAGWVLSCVRTANTDVVLEVEDLGDVELPTSKTWPCRISQLNFLSVDVVQVFLRLPPSTEFDFIPGQYIDVIGPNGVRRSYSLANASFTNKTLELHIRKVQDGVMSSYWFARAKPHDLLRLHGPLGTFFLRDVANVDLVFLATGTGIAPVKAMLMSIKNLPTNQRPKSVTVFWGVRSYQDLYLNKADLVGDHTCIPVLSRPDSGWTGEKGYVQDVLLRSAVDLSNAVVYACGSTAMVHSAKTQLVEAGLPNTRFYSDAFVSSGQN